MNTSIKMDSNSIIIGTFIKKNKILSFLEKLKYELKVNLRKIFVYNIDTNKYEYLITLKTNNKEKFITSLNNATVMHIKNSCLFSINALNELIDKNKENSNKPNNEYIIDWNQYKNKLIIKTNGELSISNLSKIEDFSTFFN